MLKQKNNIKLIIFDLFGVVFNKGLESSIDRLVAVLDRPEDSISRTYRKWEIPFDTGKIDQWEFWANVNAELGTSVSPAFLNKIVLSAYKQNFKTIMLARHLSNQYKVIIYSNFRVDWFQVLDKKYNTSSNFQHTHISSETGLLKPKSSVFKFLEEKYKIHADEMLLIDDDIKNVKGINKYGGHGVLFQNIYEAELELRNKYHFSSPNYQKEYSGILLSTKNGALILQRRDIKKSIKNSGMLSVFGGTAKRTESPVVCALRELEEETGLLVGKNDLKELKHYSYIEDSIWIKETYFHLENIDPSKIILNEGADIEVWHPNKAILQKDLTEVPRVLIESLLDKNYFSH